MRAGVSFEVGIWFKDFATFSSNLFHTNLKAAMSFLILLLYQASIWMNMNVADILAIFSFLSLLFVFTHYTTDKTMNRSVSMNVSWNNFTASNASLVHWLPSDSNFLPPWSPARSSLAFGFIYSSGLQLLMVCNMLMEWKPNMLVLKSFKMKDAQCSHPLNRQFQRCHQILVWSKPLSNDKDVTLQILHAGYMNSCQVYGWK